MSFIEFDDKMLADLRSWALSNTRRDTGTTTGQYTTRVACRDARDSRDAVLK